MIGYALGDGAYSFPSIEEAIRAWIAQLPRAGQLADGSIYAPQEEARAAYDRREVHGDIPTMAFWREYRKGGQVVAEGCINVYGGGSWSIGVTSRAKRGGRSGNQCRNAGK